MFTINAIIRKDKGKSSSRRLRIQNKFPAVIYGKKEKTTKIVLDHEIIMNMQTNPKFYQNILSICIDNKITKVKIKSIQRHPYKSKLYHIDFMRV